MTYLLLLSGLFFSVLGMSLYGKSIINNATHPSLGGLLLFSSNTAWAAFHSQELSDFLQNSLVWTSALGNLLLLLLTLGLKRWAPINRTDMLLFFGTFVAFLIQCMLTNLSHLMGILLACLLQLLGTLMVLWKMYKTPNKENAFSWLLAVICFSFGTYYQFITKGWTPSIYFSFFVLINCITISGYALFQDIKHNKVSTITPV